MLWRKYGEIIVFCYTTRTFLVFNQAKLPEIVYKSPAYSCTLSNNMFVQIWISLSTKFEKKFSESFESLGRDERTFIFYDADPVLNF